MSGRGTILAAAVLAAVAATTAWAQTPAEIDTALKAAYDKYKGLKEGANADYIPALAKVDSNIYGIALVTTDGKVYSTGDIKSEVSILSISKVFTLAEVVEEKGPDAIENNMGVMQAGSSTPSSPSSNKGAEMNPPSIRALSRRPAWFRRGAGIWNEICLARTVRRPDAHSQPGGFKSEADTNQRNQAISC
jgi:glutaminase